MDEDLKQMVEEHRRAKLPPPRGMVEVSYSGYMDALVAKHLVEWASEGAGYPVDLRVAVERAIGAIAFPEHQRRHTAALRAEHEAKEAERIARGEGASPRSWGESSPTNFWTVSPPPPAGSDGST